jgi:hypothetical protein
MKSIVETVAVLVVGFSLAGAACADLIELGDLNLEIPDHSYFGVSDTLTVSDFDGLIGDLAVFIDIGAADGGFAYNGDLYVYLCSTGLPLQFC